MGIKIGLIGCGKIAAFSHVPSFLEIPRKAKVIALYDADAKAAQGLKKAYSLQADVCPSVKDLLRSGIHGVVISTPNSTHYKLTTQALRSGVHVLVEKPMAVNLRQAETMIDLARKRNLVLQVNQSLRFHPSYAKIKEVIESGKIGKPIHIRCLRAGGMTPDKGWAPGSTWFVQKRYGGGLIMDIAVHMADLLGWYFGKARTVYAVNATRIAGNDVHDNVTALFDFANGATGVLELSWTIPSGGGFLEVYGSKGTVRMGFGSREIELSLKGREYRAIKTTKKKNSQTWFADAINGVPGCPSPGEVGRHALAYCMAIEKSGKIGKPVAPCL